MNLNELVNERATLAALERVHARVRRDRRRRVPITIGAIVLTLTVSTAAAIGIAQATSYERAYGARCFSSWSTASEGFDTLHLKDGSNDVTEDTTLPPVETIELAIEACELGWGSGIFGPTSPPAPLIACTLPDGRVGVLPHERPDQGCADIGLTPAP